MYNKNKNGDTKIMKKLLLTFLFLLASTSLSFASNSKAGTTTADFLKLSVGAQAIGMGSAYTSVLANSVDTIYWNPAGLASLTKKEVSLMYSTHFEDMSYSWISFGIPSGYGYFGLSAQYFTSGDVDEVDENGPTGATYSAYDLAAYLTYANKVKFNDESLLRFGLNLKYIQSKLYAVTASAFAVDMGVIYTLRDEATSFGAVVQNYGTKMKRDVDSEDLPLAFKLGISRIFFENLLVSVDGVKPVDNDIFPAIGAQYKIDVANETGIALRIGYDGRQKDVPGFAGFNAGFGLNIKDLSIDYAFSPYGELGDAHRVSLGFKFGKEYSDEEFAAKKAQDRAEGKKSLYEKIFKSGSSLTAPATTPAGARQQYIDESQDISGGEEGEEEYGIPYQKEVETKTIQPVSAAAITKIAILNFTSNSVVKSERDVYYEMLRKALSETSKYTVVEKRIADGILVSSDSQVELLNAFKKANAQEIIICDIVKTSAGKLRFDISVYKKDLSVKKYTVTAEDTFKDTQKKLKDFAEKIGK